MGRKTRKPTPEGTLALWYAGQIATSEAREEAREQWQAGCVKPLDIVETFNGIETVTHYERYLLNDGSGYVVIEWTDENGMESAG